MYCMMQWIKQLSLLIRLNIRFITNDQNQQQNKLVNMGNRNDLNIILTIYISNLCFLSTDVYILKTEWYLDLYMGYIFLHERILQTF